ncbi:MAG TPA: N-acyl homoserine lactonase family protein [Galbitalea sp.]|jgi:glyoxylase-like metal-dependent hydrolase (beta-lactamase superfamily II)|nr:N-acyl homoserine lactonase family protein [Galbitalea sp.]
MANVYAVRYGTLETTRSASFLDYAQYHEADRPMRMDYFYWVIESDDRLILVDTGFNPQVGLRRGREVLVDPVGALELVGHRPDDVDIVVISHFHYDHIGNLAAFPNAELVFQRRELDYWTDPVGADAAARHFVEDDEIRFLSDVVARGGARILDGDVELAPGIRAQLVGGHTPGEQTVTVETPSGLIVIAADALHFYEELDLHRPYAVSHAPPEMLAAYDTFDQLRRRGATIVAGHDPAMVRRFPSVGNGPPGTVLRIAA